MTTAWPGFKKPNSNRPPATVRPMLALRYRAWSCAATSRSWVAMLAIAGLTACCCTVHTQMHGCSIKACKPVELGLKFMESLPINL